MNFAPHEQRVLDEYRALTAKLSKLYAFFAQPAFTALPEADRVRLQAQSMFMEGYQRILNERIQAFARSHADPYMDEPVSEGEREAVAAKHRQPRED